MLIGVKFPRIKNLESNTSLSINFFSVAWSGCMFPICKSNNSNLFLDIKTMASFSVTVTDFYINRIDYIYDRCFPVSYSKRHHGCRNFNVDSTGYASPNCYFWFLSFSFIFEFDNFIVQHGIVILELLNYCFFQICNFFLWSLIEVMKLFSILSEVSVTFVASLLLVFYSNLIPWSWNYK